MTILVQVAISASFVNRGHQLWQRHPGYSPAWVWASAIVIVIVGAYCATAAFIFECPHAPSSSSDCVLPAGAATSPPTSAWTMWSVGLLVVVAVNELVKRQEIRYGGNCRSMYLSYVLYMVQCTVVLVGAQILSGQLTYSFASTVDTKTTKHWRLLIKHCTVGYIKTVQVLSRVEVRHQKRERLEFGTKLGINSPF